jgi:hypothetical protein
MGRLTNLNPIADSDLPSSIARDSEVALAINSLGISNPALSTYGSLSVKGVNGEKNGFSGIHFPNAFDAPTLMVDTLARLHGFWSPASPSGWH